MRIGEALAQTRPTLSFECYAPHSEDSVPALLERVERLARYDRLFVSVTCSTNARRQRRTLELVTQIRTTLGIEAMPHLTCLDTPRAELEARLRTLAASGVENVLALRGDPPRRLRGAAPPGEGFAHAADLVTFIAAEHDFCVAAACYPEGHPESATLAADLAFLVRKVEAGVAFLITQAFFDNARYFAFVERARAAGIRVPILPGLLPITSLQALDRLVALDPRISVPPTLRRALERWGDEPRAVAELGVAHATRQSEELLRQDAPGLHFYTLNDEAATSAVLTALQPRLAGARRAVPAGSDRPALTPAFGAGGGRPWSYAPGRG